MFDSFSSDPKKLDTAKQEIEVSIKHVESMLSDLIKSNSNPQLDIKLLSINDLVGQSSHKIDVVKSINSEHMILGDEQKLLRCFANLIENAAEAVHINHSSDGKGLIEISSRKVNINGIEYIEITIANNGPCIDDKNITRLFEPFFTKGKIKGTGLGLAFTYRVISQHKGAIRAKNKERNDGVEFIILLPAFKDVDHSNLKILILDDELLYRSMVKALINKAFAQASIFEAACVNEAIDITNKEKITHALVDIELNNSENGFTYLDHVYNKKLNMTCALHSNKYLDQNMQEKMNKYNACYIAKPLDINKLHSFIYRGSF